MASPLYASTLCNYSANMPHFVCNRIGMKHNSPSDWKHNSFTKRILNIFCMQFPLAGNHRALMPNCSQFYSLHLVAGRILKQLVWWFWSSLKLQHTAVCFADGLPNLFLFIFSAIEFVLFYPFKGKALDKVSHGIDMPTLSLSKNENKPHSCLKSYII